MLFAETFYTTSNPSSSAVVNDSSSNYLSGFFQYLATPITVFVVIGVIFIFLAFIFFIRWWMVQTAVFEMRDDIRSIRNQIVRDEVDQDETQNYEETVETDDLPEDKMDDTNKARVIDTIVQNTSMIIEKAKVAKFPKWLLVVAIAIIVILISLNVYFLFLK
jgi:hypothetical protein